MNEPLDEHLLPVPLIERLDRFVDRLFTGVIIETGPGTAVPAAEVVRAELLAIASEMAVAFLVSTRIKALEDAIAAVCDYTDCVAEEHEAARDRLRALIKKEEEQRAKGR